MGSLHKSKSTRAKRGRSVNSSSNSRRTPAPPPEAAKRKERALREGIKSFLAADRISRDAAHEHPKPTKLRTGADAPIGPMWLLLQNVEVGLETASALISVCLNTLDAQVADPDRDVAIVLSRCVLDTLERQRDRIESLLKEGDPS